MHTCRNLTTTDPNRRFSSNWVASIFASAILLRVLGGVLAASLAGSTWAAAPRADLKSATRGVTVEVDSTVLDQARPQTCFKIDKLTGEKIPCQSSGSGTGAGGHAATDDEDSQQDWEPPKAFEYFWADYDEQDFFADPESVIPGGYLLAQVAGASYRAPHDGDTLNDEGMYYLAEQWGLDHLPMISRAESTPLDFNGPEGATKAYVLYNDYAVIVSFEGSTLNLYDWWETNADIWPLSKPEWGNDNYSVCVYPFCVEFERNVVIVGHGFYDAMDLVFDDVLEAIEPLLEGRRLWITGHSLGGAVAKLTAFRLIHEYGIEVQGVHVFGAPAVGDANWANAFEDTVSNVYRWGVEGDPIPLLTWEPMFHHVGIINNLYDDGDLVLDADDSNMPDSPCGIVHGGLVDHMSYWPRMHDELANVHSHLLNLFPEPLPSYYAPCNP